MSEYNSQKTILSQASYMHYPTWGAFVFYIRVNTVHTFNTCTSRPDMCQCLVVRTPMDIMSKNKPSTLMAHVPCESKLRSVARSSMHPSPGNWAAIVCAVVYYARPAHAFSAGIKCRHCMGLDYHIMIRYMVVLDRWRIWYRCTA